MMIYKKTPLLIISVAAVSLLLIIFEIPQIGYTNQEDLPHQIHLNTSIPRGPHLTCGYCHDVPYPGYLIDNNDLATTNICDECHSPDGIYNGVDDINIGAVNNWQRNRGKIRFL